MKATNPLVERAKSGRLPEWRRWPVWLRRIRKFDSPVACSSASGERPAPRRTAAHDVPPSPGWRFGEPPVPRANVPSRSDGASPPGHPPSGNSSGPIAQRESARLTRERSLVRNQLGPLHRDLLARIHGYDPLGRSHSSFIGCRGGQGAHGRWLVVTVEGGRFGWDQFPDTATSPLAATRLNVVDDEATNDHVPVASTARSNDA